MLAYMHGCSHMCAQICVDASTCACLLPYMCTYMRRCPHICMPPQPRHCPPSLLAYMNCCSHMRAQICVDARIYACRCSPATAPPLHPPCSHRCMVARMHVRNMCICFMCACLLACMCKYMRRWSHICMFARIYVHIYA